MFESPQRPFPGFEHVFELSSPYHKRALVGELDLDAAAVAALHRGELVPDTPLRVALGGGSQLHDVTWLSSFALMVRRRVAELLTAAGFTGWRPYPLVLEGVDSATVGVDGYVGIAVTGRCDPIDYSKSEIVIEEFPGGSYPMFKGEYFDPARWDGSDIFMPSNWQTGQFVLSPVKAALEAARVRNVTFTRITDIVVDPAVATPRR